MRHIDYLALNLSNERSRLRMAKSAEEMALRAEWVRQLEREIAAESELTGDTLPTLDDDISDDDLLRELGL